MSASTCANCGASGVIIDYDGRCVGCALPQESTGIPHPGYTLFLKTHPQTDTNASTGGNCTAWRIALQDGGDVLITDGGESPLLDSTELEVGRYFANGDPVDDPELLTWFEAIEYVTRALAETADAVIERIAAEQGFGLSDILRDAMLVLFEELSDMEFDVAELGDREPREQREVAAIIEREHDKLALFFDREVIERDSPRGV